ncbi:ferredoxin family protein [Thermodesulfobacteriota bacterium]
MLLKINYGKCKVCGTCYNDCPMDVIGWDDEKGIPFALYPDECCYCGNCELYCPVEAIEIMMPARFY